MQKAIKCSNCGKFQCKDGSWTKLTGMETAMFITAKADNKITVTERLCPDCEAIAKEDFNDKWNDKNNKTAQ